MTTTRVPTVACAACTAPLSAATGLEDGTKPEAGALSICISCGNLAVFTHDGSLRAPTAEELDDPELQEVLARIAFVRAVGGFARPAWSKR